MTDDQARLGIANEVVEFGERVGCVQWQIDSATAKAGQVEDQGFSALFHLHGDPIAGANTEGVDGTGDTA